MPESLRGKHNIIPSPDAILKRPALAVQMANVIANWSHVDGVLIWIYSILMGADLPKPSPVSTPFHPVAIQVFYTLNSLGPRLDLIERLLAWKTTPETVQHFRDTLRPKIKMRFKERSIIAHGEWVILDEYPDALILANMLDGHQIYKEHDFVQISERIKKLYSQDLGDFLLSVAEIIH